MALTQEMKKEIDEMSQYRMCYHWRFNKLGKSRYFVDQETGEYFMKVLKEKGGFTPAISKSLGWRM